MTYLYGLPNATAFYVWQVVDISPDKDKEPLQIYNPDYFEPAVLKFTQVGYDGVDDMCNEKPVNLISTKYLRRFMHLWWIWPSTIM